MTDTLSAELALDLEPFAPPYFLNDNGTMFWPPECELVRWPGDWPVAQAWEKWEYDYERTRHRRWQSQLECQRCKARSDDGQSQQERWEKPVDPIAWARRHQRENHPLHLADGSVIVTLSAPVGYSWTNQRWTWEMLGFADHWDGKPTGWYNLLDGRDLSVKQWEADYIELGTAAADYWWRGCQMTWDGRCLSLWQPWASLISLGMKTIETRGWQTSYRGSLAIHAAKRPPDQSDIRLMMTLHSAMKRQLPCGKCGHDDGWHACHMTYTRCSFCGCDGWMEPPLPLGAVVATCTLVDVAPIGRWDSFRTGIFEGDKGVFPGRAVVVAHEEHLGGGLVVDTADRRVVDICDQKPYGDFTPGRWAWLLEDVRRLPEPIPARGHQGLWKPDAELAASLG